MIESLRGTVGTLGKDAAVLELGGVGWRVRVPTGTAQRLVRGQQAQLACHLLLRDDQFHLYGFATPLERDLYRILLAVSGLGPERALGLMSAQSPENIARAVHASDPAPFQIVRGIGNRLAQRIVLELQGKLDSLEIDSPGPPSADEPRENAADLTATLVKLGYPRTQVERASRSAFEATAADAPLEELVRAALRSLQKPL